MKVLPQSFTESLFGKEFSESILLKEHELESGDTDGPAHLISEADKKFVSEFLRANECNQITMASNSQVSKSDLLDMISNQIRINAKMLLLLQKQPSVIRLMKQLAQDKPRISSKPSLESGLFSDNHKNKQINTEFVFRSGPNTLPITPSLNSFISHLVPNPSISLREFQPSMRVSPYPNAAVVFNSSYLLCLQPSLKFHLESVHPPGHIFNQFHPLPVRNGAGQLYEHPMSRSTQVIHLPTFFPPQAREFDALVPLRRSNFTIAAPSWHK